MYNSNTSKACFQRKRRKERGILLLLILLVLALSFLLLLLGDKVYAPGIVLRVLAGEDIKGPSYAIHTIRLPRTLCGILAGCAFGIAGNTFQKIMRNTLASPDILGISSGASAAAVAAMLLFGLSGMTVSVLALCGGLAAAFVIIKMSGRGHLSTNRMILTGIGMQALLQGVINFILMKHSDYDMGTALRWLSGSLNGSRMEDVTILAPVTILGVACILLMESDLKILQLGEALPITLGMNINRSRMLVMLAAVLLCAGAASVTGPLASVALMAGPIAAGLTRTGGINTLASGMVGAALVLAAELVGQFAFATRYPVGVITGVIGAPYLILLLIRMNRT